MAPDGSKLEALVSTDSETALDNRAGSRPSVVVEQ